jgi:hydrogenase maturation protease
LQRRLVDQGDVEVVATHQLNPEHAELVARAELAVFIDASAQGPPGTIVHLPVAPAETSSRPSTHNLTPQTLLACARELYGRCPEAVLFAVGAGDFSCGGVSRPIANSLPLLVAEVASFCVTPACVEAALPTPLSAAR